MQNGGTRGLLPGTQSQRSFLSGCPPPSYLGLYLKGWIELIPVPPSSTVRSIWTFIGGPELFVMISAIYGLRRLMIE